MNPGLGTIIPNMGSKGNVADALFSRTQQRLLGLLLLNPNQSYFANELVRLSGSGVGAVHRELASLEAAGLVTTRRVGNQKHYQANRAAPIYEELHAIARKTLGPLEGPLAAQEAPARYESVPEALRVPGKKLRALCRKFRIRRLSAFGSAARGEAKARSDVDLMVEFDPDNAPSLWEFPEMQLEFSKLFGRPVQLVPPQVLENPHRRKTILPDLRVLYAA